MIESAEDRIRFQQIVDAIEQGSGDLLPVDAVDEFVRQGLLSRQAERIDLTEEGRRLYDSSRRERQATS